METEHKVMQHHILLDVSNSLGLFHPIPYGFITHFLSGISNTFQTVCKLSYKFTTHTHTHCKSRFNRSLGTHLWHKLSFSALYVMSHQG